MSTRRSFVPLSCTLLLTCSLVAALGCGSDDPYIPPIPPLADTGPLNASPESTMARFEWAYENQRAGDIEALLTDDFRFLFSAQTDPDLVTKWGENWMLAEESQAIRHLFDGFTNTQGDAVPGATRIELWPNALEIGPDSTRTDSTGYYRIAIAPRMQLEIEIPDNPGPLVFSVDSRQVFHLVRGDAAALAPGQEARSDRWYIRRWSDMASPIAAPDRGPRPWATQPVTWGMIKASYHR